MKNKIITCLRALRAWLRDWLNAFRLLFALRHQHYFARKSINAAQNSGARRPPKPEWVRKEVIRLKAFMVHDGCRTITHTFNRLYRDKKQMTVGKTYVYETLKKHYYEVLVVRRKIKHRKPKSLPKNLIWAMDLTQVSDESEQHHTLFGLLDSGTRACLDLRHLRTKASIAILRALCDAIECYAKPRAVRTDNEAVFVSRVFRFGLYLLGIKHQRTEVCCPWMNGKIERFFGTLKERLRHYVLPECPKMSSRELVIFRLWYNHVRVHQHLNGRTPAEAWNRTTPDLRGKPLEFSAWNGALAGVYLPPS